MMNTLLTRTNQLIDREGLNQKNRKREKIFYKIAISYILRKNGFTTTTIGRLFNVDHSSVVHYDRRFASLKRDKSFQAINNEVKMLLNPQDFNAKIERAERSLTQKVLSCENYWQLVQLQQELLEKM